MDEPRSSSTTLKRPRPELAGHSTRPSCPVAVPEQFHLAALAIRAEIPLDTLMDYVAQFPTYSEAYLKALDRLEL